MIERENTPMTTSSDVIAGLELALASADAMIERLQGERAILRDSVIEECAKVCAGIDQDWPAMSDTTYPEYIAKKLRALKSQLAAPDPRDEVIQLAREAITNMLKAGRASNRLPTTVSDAEQKLDAIKFAVRKAEEALAAIDKVMEGK